jgi:hypothetical protein
MNLAGQLERYLLLTWLFEPRESVDLNFIQLAQLFVRYQQGAIVREAHRLGVAPRKRRPVRAPVEEALFKGVSLEQPHRRVREHDQSLAISRIIRANGLALYVECAKQRQRVDFFKLRFIQAIEVRVVIAAILAEEMYRVAYRKDRFAIEVERCSWGGELVLVRIAQENFLSVSRATGRRARLVQVIEH